MKYTVQPGDTLYKISRRYGISLDALVAANPQIEDPSVIIPGMVINIPGSVDNDHDGYNDSNHCACIPNSEKWSEVCLPVPYPEVNVEKPNTEYAKMMLDILADCSSELTAIHKYLYYYTMLEDTPYEEVAELLEAISIIEMRHMHDIMKFIKLLGCEPVYENSRGKPWCAAYVNYELYNVCNLLMDVTQEEEDTAKLYRDMAAYINDKYISAWLLRAAEDEEHHAKLFKKYYCRYCKPMG
ncbi:bacterioferritin [Desulfohalotomaculum tongense]|uniref:LysM peptidoglycan-binding domain-containing protein n=1 Tax=Desulforadius tongensis TaxID=1216062 RepID=UPI0019588D6D|nr:LysM peptidoglycan-binding domain-containing protein [Desulforadius tongensis]MBM7854085.1 bacterioferritin [Desulforadius tongensis]